MTRAKKAIILNNPLRSFYMVHRGGIRQWVEREEMKPCRCCGNLTDVVKYIEWRNDGVHICNACEYMMLIED